MTSHDENRIIRTTPGRLGKGLIVVFAFMAVVGFVIITNWTFMLSIPPPVSVPKPSPEQTQAAPGGGGAGSGAQTAAPPAGTLSIPSGASTQGNPSYEPAKLTVKKGDAVTVVNDDSAPHTATNGEGPDDPKTGKSFDTSLIMAGKSAKIDTSTLDAGDYPYHCTVHPFMKGTLSVTA
jgi:plastocyanin